MAWDPKIYLNFADERTRPAAELLARVAFDHPERVIDLGCGPGNSTALLARRWPGAALEGLDSSQAMLDEARKSGVAAQWTLGDIASWTPAQRYDVIFSNATLHWVADQETLLPRLMSFLSANGVLAFQVPCNFNAPSHTLMRAVAADGPWAPKMKNVRDQVLGTARGYFDILETHAVALDIWETTYLQILSGEDAVFRWVSGTGLRPFLDALEGAEREAYISEYKKRLAEAYPMRPSGKVLFPFQRLFVVARRG